MLRNKLTFLLLGRQYGFDMSKLMQDARDFQYWPQQRIDDYQNGHLRNLVQHAYDHTVYYRELFDRLHLKPSDIQSKEDLEKLPVIRKKDVAENYEKFLAADYKQYHPMKRATGGTTGVSFPYFNDTKSWAVNWATKMRVFDWGGYTFGDDVLGVLAGGSLVANDKLSIKNRLWRYLNNYYTMPITHMDSATMMGYYEHLKSKKIKFLRGYPTAVFTFADFLKGEGLSLKLQSVFTTAEMLYDAQRKVIEEVFQCKVFDMYGCGDGMGHASECECHEGLHICQDASIMQIVDADGVEVAAGQEGEIVLTSLFDYAMPLLRYAPGDMAIKADCPCSCGRSMPLIKKIIGRTTDIIQLSNGRVLNGLSIPFEAMIGELNHFQIVQKRPDFVEVLLEPKTELSEKQIKSIEDMMRFHCGEGVSVAVRIVEEIPLPKSGKLRYVISEVQ